MKSIFLFVEMGTMRQELFIISAVDNRKNW
jgi:hypothetical protein